MKRQGWRFARSLPYSMSQKRHANTTTSVNIKGLLAKRSQNININTREQSENTAMPFIFSLFSYTVLWIMAQSIQDFQ
jgi:hypothetical protein